MPSGSHLTAEDKLRIMRLASERASDGGWRFRVGQIAGQCGVHREAVRKVIREGCWLYCEGVAQRRGRV